MPLAYASGWYFISYRSRNSSFNDPLMPYGIYPEGVRELSQGSLAQRAHPGLDAGLISFTLKG